MKVTIKKTFVTENGTSILKGRIIDVAPEKISELESKGIIEVTKADKPKKKKTEE